LREIALIAKEFAEQRFDQLRNGLAVIDIPWRERKSEDFAIFVDDQMELEPIEPTERTLTTRRQAGKDFVSVDAVIGTPAQITFMFQPHIAIAQNMLLDISRSYTNDACLVKIEPVPNNTNASFSRSYRSFSNPTVWVDYAEDRLLVGPGRYEFHALTSNADGTTSIVQNFTSCILVRLTQTNKPDCAVGGKHWYRF
jgi:hypothetical protein